MIITIINVLTVTFFCLIVLVPFTGLLLGFLFGEPPEVLLNVWLTKLDLWLDRHLWHPERYK